MLLWIHPILQSLTGLLALYVLWLGLTRFAGRHFGSRTVFRWKRHVLLGKAVVVIWTLGAAGGLTMTYVTYGRIFPGSLHFIIGVLALLLMLVAWLTGSHLDRHRDKSDVLPVLHMTNNLLLLILVAMQLYTGIGIIQSALLAG
ncbi:MAG: DUF4079 family protein [Desulfobacterales bacterium]